MKVQTVTGPIDVEEMGRTLIHEHINVVWPGAQLDPEPDMERPLMVKEIVRRLRELKERHGIQTMVDPCPMEVGRDVSLMAEVSEKAEFHIVCTTGFYHDSIGLPAYWRVRSEREIADLYVREITRGVAKTGIRPAAIKVATGAPKISELEMKCISAACIAHRETGVPLITHTQKGMCGPEQQQAFQERGVDLGRSLIGHCCDNPNHEYHRGIVERGSFIGFDRIGMATQSDDVRADNLAKLVQVGYIHHVAMSQDRFCCWNGRPLPTSASLLTPEERAVFNKDPYGWAPGWTHLFTDFIPKLKQRGVTDEQIGVILHDNPQRFFSGPGPRSAAKH